MVEVADTVTALTELYVRQVQLLESVVLLSYIHDTDEILEFNDMVDEVCQRAAKRRRKKGKNGIRRGDLWLEINLPHNNSHWVVFRA